MSVLLVTLISMQLIWINWTTSKFETSKKARFIDTIRDCILYQHIQPIRPTRSRGGDNPSTIDLLFLNEEMQISNLEHHHHHLVKSDYSVIAFDFIC